MRKTTFHNLICPIQASLFILFFILFFSLDANAATPSCEIYEGDNVEAQNYKRASNPIMSYLEPCGNGNFMRIQANTGTSGIVVEYYDSSYNHLQTKLISKELPIFGGFYSTNTHYFLITGQENPEQSKYVESFRITKYDKSWNRITAASLKECNTIFPFHSGCVRMATCGDYLLIRTSHTMYRSDDGLSHQANVTISVNMNTMEITDSFTDVGNIRLGYVSHSFNQFIQLENNQIIAVDHGDAYPRSIVLIKYPTDASTGRFYSRDCGYTNLITFPGAIGDNSTGASIGGFEVSSSSYLVAGNYVGEEKDYTTCNTRNIFVSVCDKTTNAVTTKWFTSYEEGAGTTTTPHLIKIEEDRYLLMWSKDNQVSYTLLDGQANQLSGIYTYAGNLSDCVPTIINGKLVWYTWNNKIMNYHDISLTDLSKFETTTLICGHDDTYTSTSNGYATLTCKRCSAKRKVATVTSFDLEKRKYIDGGWFYRYSFNDMTLQKEDVFHYRLKNITYDKDWEEYNTDIEVISSNPSIVQVTPESAVEGEIKALAYGTVTLTFRPKFNPSLKKSYKITVTGPLNINSFTASKTSPQPANTAIKLSAKGSLGYHPYEYEFSVKKGTGKKKVIRAFKNSNSCTWKPTSNGTYTLYVKIKDDYGNSVTKKLPYTISSKKTVKKNVTATINNIKYKVTKAGSSKKAQVAITGVKNKNISSLTIPATVKIKGVECKVVSIASKAFYNCKKLKSLTIKPTGLNTKNVGNKAFTKAGRNNYKKLIVKVPKKQYSSYKKLLRKKGLSSKVRIRKY